MAKPSIQNITTTDTFQNWFDKTNEMVNIFKNEVITASAVGDTTIGDAFLQGEFKAESLVANTTLLADSITSKTSGGNISFETAVNITGATPICSTFINGSSGGRTRYTDGAVSWDIGMKDSSSAYFLINTGVGDNKFELSPAGTLYVKNIIVDEDITANNIFSSTIGKTTDDIEEGEINLYFTEERAIQSFSSGTGINITAEGVISTSNVDATTLDGIDSSSFLRSDTSDAFTGSELDVRNKLLAGSLEVDGTASFESSVYVGGSIFVDNDIITDADVSDIRLKENLSVIENALVKVNSLNGYVYNLKSNPDRKFTGLVAQELEQVLPEAVSSHVREDHEHEVLNIQYGNTVGLLVEAIKELTAKVDLLEQELKTLKR